MITDPVYEGKSMQGLIDLVKKGYFQKGAKVLYAHLGGAPRAERVCVRVQEWVKVAFSRTQLSSRASARADPGLEVRCSNHL